VNRVRRKSWPSPPDRPRSGSETARRSDIAAVQALIDTCIRSLHAPFYNNAGINLALSQLVAIDEVHVDEGMYVVAGVDAVDESSPSDATSTLAPKPIIIGCSVLVESRHPPRREQSEYIVESSSPRSVCRCGTRPSMFVRRANANRGYQMLALAG